MNLIPNEMYLNMMKIKYFNDLTKLWKLLQRIMESTPSRTGGTAARKYVPGAGELILTGKRSAQKWERSSLSPFLI